MKITFTSRLEAPGIPISECSYGDVVRRACAGDTLYLVISVMDGTGHRALVTLASGNLKPVDQNTRVMPVQTELLVYTA